MVLSLFPGIDIFGRAFEACGFCVVRGPDLIFGGDIRDFHPPLGHVEGVIGGPPCQDFSAARRTAPTGYGLEMLGEFVRVIDESRPEWFVMENVPRVPDVTVQGYTVQRIDLNSRECGMEQSRLRHFQFGSQLGHTISVNRRPANHSAAVPTLCASRGNTAGRVTFERFCELQGLPGPLTLPGFTRDAAFRAVGNGVPFPMGKAIAEAVRARSDRSFFDMAICACGCGRLLSGREKCASPGCRKRLERHRKHARPGTICGKPQS